MSPRSRNVVPPKVEPTGNTNRVPTRRSRARVQTRTTGAPQDGELFDLDVSGSEDDYDPARDDHDSDLNPTVEKGDTRIHINDPDAVPSPKGGAGDINYFFDRSGDNVVCKVCRQVSLHSQLFSFLNRQLTTQSLGRPRKQTRPIGL